MEYHEIIKMYHPDKVRAHISSSSASEWSANVQEWEFETPVQYMCTVQLGTRYYYMEEERQSVEVVVEEFL